MPTDDPDPVGSLFGRADEARIDLADLANLTSLSESHLRNIRNGHRRLTPDLHRQILDALTALGVDTSELPRPAGDPE